MIENKITVSVCMITYNHEKYIAQAIEGVLMQKTNFPIELIIGEDCSKDNTRNICIEYQKKYPHLIKLILNEQNIGIMPNFVQNLKACTGKYIALCEGDDYWTDPLKLQKQVDFLENNREYILSVHNAKIINENGDSMGLFNTTLKKHLLDIYDIINSWIIPTASMVFRKESLIIPEWINYIPNGDLALQLILAGMGRINYADEVMNVYRKHNEGISTRVNKNPIKYLQGHKFLWKKINQYYDYKYNSQFQKKIFHVNLQIIKQKIIKYSAFLMFIKNLRLKKSIMLNLI